MHSAGEQHEQWRPADTWITCAAQANSTSSGEPQTCGPSVGHVHSAGEQHEQWQTADMWWGPSANQ